MSSKEKCKRGKSQEEGETKKEEEKGEEEKEHGTGYGGPRVSSWVTVVTVACRFTVVLQSFHSRHVTVVR